MKAEKVTKNRRTREEHDEDAVTVSRNIRAFEAIVNCKRS
jgi:hypothetical protein